MVVHGRHVFRKLEIEKYGTTGILECCAIELLKHKVIIICIYRPPRNDSKHLDRFFTTLSLMLHEFCYTDKKVIICGDLNINTLKKTKDVDVLAQLIHSYNLRLAINEPTRLSSGTCIDHFIYNVRGCKHKVYEFALSDHTAQMLSCPVTNTCSISHWYVYRRDYCRENVQKFKDSLQSLSFSEVYSTDDPNKAFDIFHETFTLFYNLCVPINIVKISTKKKPRWISNGIRKCSKRKRDLLWRYRKQCSEHNRQAFKAYSARLSKIIKLTQKSQNDYMIKNASNKCRATWSVIKQNKSCMPKQSI